MPVESRRYSTPLPLRALPLLDAPIRVMEQIFKVSALASFGNLLIRILHTVLEPLAQIIGDCTCAFSGVAQLCNAQWHRKCLPNSKFEIWMIPLYKHQPYPTLQAEYSMGVIVRLQPSKAYSASYVNCLAFLHDLLSHTICLLFLHCTASLARSWRPSKIKAAWQLHGQRSLQYYSCTGMEGLTQNLKALKGSVQLWLLTLKGAVGPDTQSP